MSCFRSVLFVLVTVLFISACGGSSGGSGNNDENGSGGGDNGNDTTTPFTISGTVTAPGGAIAQFRDKNLIQILASAVLPAAYADIIGFTPVANATVELVRLDAQGNEISVIATTTTNTDGAYTFDTDEAPSALLLARATNGSIHMMSLAVSETTDVNPITTVVTQQIMNQLAISGSLEDITEEEVNTLVEYIDTLNLDLSSAGTINNALNQIDAGLGAEFGELIESVSAPGDSVPTDFSFQLQTDVLQNTLITSNSVTVSGITAPTTVVISGGEYSINGSPFTTDVGSIDSGDTIGVRLISSNGFSATSSATLTIGGISAVFSVTTLAEDTTPDAFTFNDQINVSVNTPIESNSIMVAGINSSATISIQNGEYSINGSGYTANPSLVNNGDTIQVRQTSSSSFSTATNTILTIGPISDTFSLTTEAAPAIDITPDPFVFIDQTDVALSTQIISNVITISGINAAAPISILGGEYSINSGVFTGTAGVVNSGDSVVVRQASSDSFSIITDVVLTVGAVNDTFSVTTVAEDSVPDAFDFVGQIDVLPESLVSSNTVTISGINSQVLLSIEGGTYSIDGGSFQSVDTLVSNGQTIQLSAISPTQFLTSTTVTITIGSVVDTFIITTVEEDSEPDSFRFSEQADVPTNTLITSNAITVSGINTPVPIRVSGGEYSIDGGPFTFGVGVISEGQSVVVRQASSDDYSVTTDLVLTIGGISDTFSITTLFVDTTPDPFSFTDQFDVARNTDLVSNNITVSGLDSPTTISVSGGQYSIDGAPFTTEFGQVAAGQSVTIKQRSLSTFSSTSNVTVNIGGVVDVFSVTTLTNPYPNAPAAAIHFPTEDSVTDSSRIIVRGICNDSDGVSAVRVNGVDATTTDGFRNWQAEVILNYGMNILTVEAVDNAGHINPEAALAQIEYRFPYRLIATSVEIDRANNRALVTARSVNVLLAIDLVSGERSVVSGMGVGSGPDFSAPRDVTLDSVRNRAIVVDQGADAIIAVNLLTGDRTILSDNMTGSGPDFITPSVAAMDFTNQRMFVIDGDGLNRFNAILEVDIVTGERSIIADSTTGTGHDFSDFFGPKGIVYDEANERVLVLENPRLSDFRIQGLLVGIDLNTLDRVIFSSLMMRADSKLALDANNNRVLAGAGRNIIAVDLASGSQSTVSTLPIAEDLRVTVAPDIEDVALGVTDNTLLTIDATFYSALFLTDLITEDTVTISDSSKGLGRAVFTGLTGIVLSADNKRAYAISSVEGWVLEINLTNGDRKIIYQPSGSFSPFGIALDEVNNRVFIANRARSDSEINFVNLVTGERAVISSTNTLGENIVGSGPRLRLGEMVLDDTNNRLLVSSGGALTAVEISTGERSILSDNSVGVGPSFSSPSGVVLRPSNNRVLAIDGGSNSLLAVDLNTGNRTIISGDGVGVGPDLNQPKGIAFDSDNNLVFVANDDEDGEVADSLLAIDLDSGDRSIISDGVTNSGPIFNFPGGLAIDISRNLGWILTGGYEQLLAIDLITGERVMVSHGPLR